MSRVVVDQSLISKLNGLNTDIEFCDQSGRALGHFIPQDLYLRWIYDWCNAQVTDEELKKESEKPGGRALKEIWERLGNK
jgi:hypothetical protein